jgi:hypothetical protein
VNFYGIYKALREINEYIPGYLRARSKDAVFVQGYYGLNDYNGYVLGAKQMDSNAFHFVMWQKDQSGDGYNHGHYYNEDYMKAGEG